LHVWLLCSNANRILSGGRINATVVGSKQAKEDVETKEAEKAGGEKEAEETKEVEVEATVADGHGDVDEPVAE